MAVLVVPVSCVSHGGLEHTTGLAAAPAVVSAAPAVVSAAPAAAMLVCSPPMLDVAVDGVLVVPVS